MPLTRLPAWAYLIAGMIPIIVLLFVGEMMPRQVTLILLALAAVWAATLVAYHWKRLDEAARAAHRWAWYWGGSSGLALAIAAVGLSMNWPELAAAFAGLAQHFEGGKFSPLQAHLFLGVMFTGGMQALGFLGAWIIWWLTKR